jgi:membrane protease YdiL (CAAX protease family)
LACCGRLANKRILKSAHPVATQRAVRWRFGIGWWLAVLAGLPVLTVIHADVRQLAGINPPVTLFWDQLRLLLINFILVNLREETAWAGVMQTRLERRHNIFVAAALTAVLFGFITCRSPSSARSPSHRC